MSGPRACQSCRNAKARCDQARPSCGRCRAKGKACTGYPAANALIFRDENAIARNNSERARRVQQELQTVELSLHPPSFSRVSSSLDSPDGTPPQFTALAFGESTLVKQRDLWEQLPWLSLHGLASIPELPKRSRETAAVDRFFIDWTLHPANNGVSPGHLQDLPMLYLSAPDETVLKLAVKAVAFADMKNVLDGSESFSVKARKSYGAALSRMREAAADERRVANDRILAALLLIDNFELMFLSREEPLGPHSDAVWHVLRARGEQQFHSEHSFALWRIAHHRLMARQILQRSGPYPEQIEWLKNLNVNRPDLHISSDCLQMNVLCAAAKKLTDGQVGGTAGEKAQHAQQLIGAIRSLTNAMDGWTSHLKSTAWGPRIVDVDRLLPPTEAVGHHSTERYPPLPQPHILRYQDNWLAYIWNFHSASQIVLRESLVDVIEYYSDIADFEEPEYLEVATSQYDTVRSLSENIMESYPPLLGFQEDPTEETCFARGKMAGRFFILFSMWVVQRAKFTTSEHKQLASRVTDWIKSSHRI